MKTHEDLRRALNIRYGGYGNVIDIKGYKPIHYEHTCVDKRGWFFSFEEYQYTWGGQSVYEPRCKIYFDEFDDDMTDEEVVKRFIELLDKRYSSRVREEHL